VTPPAINPAGEVTGPTEPPAINPTRQNKAGEVTGPTKDGCRGIVCGAGDPTQNHPPLKPPAKIRPVRSPAPQNHPPLKPPAKIRPVRSPAPQSHRPHRVTGPTESPAPQSHRPHSVKILISTLLNPVNPVIMSKKS